MTTFLWNHTARLGGALNKKSVCRKKRDRKSFSSGEQKKDEMLISGGRQLLHYAPRRHKHAATVSITKGFCWGRLALRSKRRHLSSLKKKTFTICQQIEERDRLWLCELKSTATFNLKESTVHLVHAAPLNARRKVTFPSWLSTSTVRSPGGFLWHKQREHVNTSSGCPGAPWAAPGRNNALNKSCWMF